MENFRRRSFLGSGGQTAVEYALILAAVALLVYGATKQVGGSDGAVVANASQQLQSDGTNGASVLSYQGSEGSGGTIAFLHQHRIDEE